MNWSIFKKIGNHLEATNEEAKNQRASRNKRMTTARLLSIGRGSEGQ